MKKILTILSLHLSLTAFAQKQGPLPFDCEECLAMEQKTLNGWIGSYSWDLLKQFGAPASVSGDSINGYTLVYENKTSYTIHHTATTSGHAGKAYITTTGKLVYYNYNATYKTDYDTEEAYTRLFIAHTDKNGLVYQWTSKTKS